MDGEKKNIVYVIIVLIALALVGYVVFGNSSSSSTPKIVAPKPVTVKVDIKFDAAQVLNQKPLSDTQNSAIATNKAAILSAVRSGKALTSQQRTEIGNVMLTEAHLYKFTAEEQKDILDALGRP